MSIELKLTPVAEQESPLPLTTTETVPVTVSDRAWEIRVPTARDIIRFRMMMQRETLVQDAPSDADYLDILRDCVTRRVAADQHEVVFAILEEWRNLQKSSDIEALVEIKEQIEEWEAIFVRDDEMVREAYIQRQAVNEVSLLLSLTVFVVGLDDRAYLALSVDDRLKLMQHVSSVMRLGKPRDDGSGDSLPLPSAPATSPAAATPSTGPAGMSSATSMRPTPAT